MVEHGVEHWMVAPIASGHDGRPVKLRGAPLGTAGGNKTIFRLHTICIVCRQRERKAPMNSQTLTLKVEQVRAYAKKYKTTSWEDAASEAEKLLALYKAAGNTPPPDLEKELLDITSNADKLAGIEESKPPMTTGKKFSIGAIAILAFVVIGTLIWFVRGSGNDVNSPDGTRLLLVFALIISTLTFGGALILGSLFSEEPLEIRFRHAREIFLVFSGIFATLTGFYFGSEGPKNVQQQQAVREITAINGAVAKSADSKLTKNESVDQAGSLDVRPESQKQP